MKQALAIIERAIAEHPAACVAFSGGDDSLTVLHMITQRQCHRLPVFYAHTPMEHPQTLPFVVATCKRYVLELHVEQIKTATVNQWNKAGWPMLGKMIARKWNRQHKGRGFGFKTDYSSCCRAHKIAPVRAAMKAAGISLQFTGLRGSTDSAARGLSTKKHGATHYNKTDKIWVCNPIAGFTDLMGQRYIKQNGLTRHPAKAKGAETIGCMVCGGGAQFTGSCYPHARRLSPRIWHRWIVTARMGEIILAIKYDEPLQRVRAALDSTGGLAAVAKARPWVFDFVCMKPLQGYDKR